MGGISVFHWLTVIVMIAVVVVPAVKILKKAGFSGWWAILSFIPLLNLVFLWVFAFIDWPSNRGTREV